MKNKSLKLKNRRLSKKLVIPLLFIGGFAAIGAAFLAFSSAAAGSATGWIDYCRLENNITVIYGWAHDGDVGTSNLPYATVKLGSQSKTVPTNISGYRDKDINEFLALFGIKTSSRYGFRVEFPGVYKGSSVPISGTANAVGAGGNGALFINQEHSKAVGAGGSFFPGSLVPSICLADKPAPTPQPTPTQPNTPALTQPKSSQPRSSRTNTSSPQPSTTETPVSGESESPLAPLIPGQTATFSFLENGEVITISSGEILGTGLFVFSNDEGALEANDLEPGTYVLAFSHNGKKYEYEFTVGSTETAGQILSFDVDISELVPVAEGSSQTGSDEQQESSGSIWPTIIMLFVVGLAIFLVRFFWKRRKSSNQSTDNAIYDLSSLPTAPPAQQALPNRPLTPEEIESHMGVSLKDMVIKSMREEAARRKPKDQ